MAICYHGSGWWYEIEGLEEPRLVRAHDVTESMEEIVAELRRTDETPSLAEINVEKPGPISSEVS
jgi:hypothetical protein